MIQAQDVVGVDRALSLELLCGIFAFAGIAVGVVASVIVGWARKPKAVRGDDEPGSRDDEPASMSNQQLVVAALLSIASLLLASVHLRWPEVVPLNTGTLALLALAALPWLTLFVKSGELPGLGKWESRENKKQGTARPVAPADDGIRKEEAATLSPEARKVLATLWRYQRGTFGSDKSRRWTFAVQSIAPDYAAYLLGVADAMRRGLVALAPETKQCMLTNDGLAFVEKDGGFGDDADHYHF
ncbi:MAG: hypothetical protein K8J09_00455 [Planctomycetes bacterium]|nr:hypothetical protein [Planctomycetota bacterium]MCC7395635.1 hypothetical protein [Planctomycetota bacterium]